MFFYLDWGSLEESYFLCAAQIAVLERKIPSAIFFGESPADFYISLAVKSCLHNTACKIMS